METKSQRPKGRDGAISALNVAIETLNLAKEVSSITPAKAVFGSVSVILTMIKVSLLCFFVGRLQTEMHLGNNDQRNGLCRTWASMCRSLYGPQPGTGREEIERAQGLSVRGNQPANDVSYTDTICFESLVYGGFWLATEPLGRSR